MITALTIITSFTMFPYITYILMAEPVLFLRKPVKGTAAAYKWMTAKIICRYIGLAHLAFTLTKNFLERDYVWVFIDLLIVGCYIWIIQRDKDDDNFFRGLGTKIKNAFTIKRLDTAPNFS